MEIKKIQLEYIHKHGFSSLSADEVCHIKTLPYLTVAQAVEGNYDIKLGNGDVYNTEIGGFFIAPSDVQQTITHHANKTNKNMICRWVFLKIRMNDLYKFDAIYDLPVILPETHKTRMNLLFDRLFATDNVFDEYVYYYEIVQTLSLVAKEKTGKIDSYLENALDYIKHNYQSKINVHMLAERANVSDSYLFSLFKKHTGVSPIVYLNNYRVSIAAELLLQTSHTIVEISEMIGINDSVYFNKLFRKYYQTSPSKFRESHKETDPSSYL